MKGVDTAAALSPPDAAGTIRLLLVDDTANVHQTLLAMLAVRAGGRGATRRYTVDLVQTVEAGLEALRAGAHHCYLVDHRVAGKTGVEMIRQARTETITAPIIMLTATGMVENEAAEAGANDFLIKGSFDTPALERAIRYAIGNADALRRLAALNASLEVQVAERTRAIAATNARLVEQIQARERAEAALLRTTTLEALGRMTGLVAHDFNNILTVLFGSLESLEKRLGADADARLLRPLAHAREAARRGERMMEGLLAFARRRPIAPQRLDVNAVLAEADDMLRLAGGVRVALTLRPGADLPPISADRDQLERALVNLITNARDAVADRQDGQVEIVTSHDAGRVRIAVADNGLGMPPEVLERAFEPLFSTKPDGRGTGLGLAQVYGFAQATGGTAELDNHPGAGLTVILDLPALQDSRP